MSYTVTLELNEEQTKVVLLALEEYCRLGMGQMYDLAERIAMKGYDFRDDKDSKKFGKIMNRRNHAKIAFDCAYRIASDDRESYGLPIMKSEDEDVCMDVWTTLRHVNWLANGNPLDTWNVASRPPLRMSQQPLPKCFYTTDGEVE